MIFLQEQCPFTVHSVKENLTRKQDKYKILYVVVKLFSRVRLHDPMDQSMPSPPVFQCPPELGQIHVGCFDDAVQPSHPLSSPSPLALTLSQHQGLF